MPHLVQVARETTDVDVLLVSYDLQLPRSDRTTVVARVQKFVDEQDWRLPVVIFDALDYDAINERFDLPGGLPVTLAIDATGRIVDREDGPSDRGRFRQLAESVK